MNALSRKYILMGLRKLIIDPREILDTFSEDNKLIKIEKGLPLDAVLFKPFYDQQGKFALIIESNHFKSSNPNERYPQVKFEYDTEYIKGNKILIMKADY